MKSEGTSFDQLRETLDKLSGARVHVLGDTIVDSYTHCSMVGGMVKTPTVSVKYENQTNFVGGAGIVAKHLRRAGAEVVFSTVLGDDELKGFVLDDLQSEGIEVRAYIDKSRPTTQKNTFISNGYHLLRVGKVDNLSLIHISEPTRR